MPSDYSEFSVVFKCSDAWLQPEGNGQHDTHWDGVIAHLAHTPAGHLADDAYRFTVKALIASATNHTHIAHLAVGAHNETAQHVALDALLVCMIGIFARLVDEIDQPTLTAGELRLDVHVVILINLHIGLFGHGVDSGDMTHLCCHGQHCSHDHHEQ